MTHSVKAVKKWLYSFSIWRYRLTNTKFSFFRRLAKVKSYETQLDKLHEPFCSPWLHYASLQCCYKEKPYYPVLRGFRTNLLLHTFNCIVSLI